MTRRCRSPTRARCLSGVLGRTVAMLAARANFSLDRLSDAQLVSDAVAAHALGHAAAGALRVEVDDDERALAIRVGPLTADGGERVVKESDLPGVGLLLEHLVDDVAVDPRRRRRDARAAHRRAPVAGRSAS